MKRKFIKVMAVGISAMMLMSSTLVYAEEGSDGGGEPVQSEESSSEENSGDSGSGEESSDNSGDSGEAHQEGGSNESTPAEEPAAETPAAEQPAPETPVNETLAPETPAAETPAAAQPATGTEVTDPAAATTPAATDPAVTDPATGETVVTNPAAAGTVTEGTEPAGDGTVTVPTDTLTDPEKSVDSDDVDDDAEENETTTFSIGGFFDSVAEVGNETVLLMQKTVQKAVDSVTGNTEEEEADAAALNEPDKNPTIAGGYIDWSNVELAPLSLPQHADGTNYDSYGNNKVAWMQKGDYVYIYLEDQNIAETSTGAHSTGNYAINSDLGYKIVFKLNSDGTITSNTDGITAVYVADNDGKWYYDEETGETTPYTGRWEIRVSNDVLPQNTGNISFGLYNTTKKGEDGYTPYTLEMATTSNSVVPFSGETNDQGYIDSWDGRGVVQLDYTTDGTHAGEADGFTALYGDGDNIYGMTTTTLPEHVKAGNYCMMEFDIATDEDLKNALRVRMVGIDAEGNYDWNTSGLVTDKDGVYEYHIFGVDTWGNFANYADYETKSQWMDEVSKARNQDFGKALVTVKEGKVTLEWFVDSDKYAAYMAKVHPESGILSASDLKEVTASYHRIGGKITTAGASSGPVANAGMCLAACLMGLALNKKKLVTAVQKAKAEV